MNCSSSLFLGLRQFCILFEHRKCLVLVRDVVISRPDQIGVKVIIYIDGRDGHRTLEDHRRRPSGIAVGDEWVAQFVLYFMVDSSYLF